MGIIRKKVVKTAVMLFLGGSITVMIIMGIVILRTMGRTMIQVDIHQNKELIHLSTFAEPPQFAIWLEDPKSGERKTVFVTHRVAIGDWEGKANVPVALPKWYQLRGNENSGLAGGKSADFDAVTGATPKDDWFTVRVEVEPGSEWICWIEMNLSGDYNEAYPEFNAETFYEDEFGNGQPALLFKADIKAVEDMTFTPSLEAQSIWEDGVVSIEPVSDGVTTARYVFDTIQISIVRPKPKLIEKYKIKN
jgi:hypothetical protein